MESSEHPATIYMKRDAELMSVLEAPPAAATMNAVNNKRVRYLMVAPNLRETAVGIEQIANVCRRIIRLSADGGLLDELDGIEIMPRVVRNGIAVRLLRLSIFRKAIEQARNISPHDLRQPVPFEGCTSLIYVENLR